MKCTGQEGLTPIKSDKTETPNSVRNLESMGILCALRFQNRSASDTVLVYVKKVSEQNHT